MLRTIINKRFPPYHKIHVFRQGNDVSSLYRFANVLVSNLRPCNVNNYRLLSSSIGKDGSDYHLLYKEQIQELERERAQIFGTNQNSTDDDPLTSINNNSRLALSKSYDDEYENETEVNVRIQQDHSDTDWENMSNEREASFNFTFEEKQAWSVNNVHTSKHKYSTNENGTSKQLPIYSPEFMEAIRKAREIQDRHEKEFETEKEKMNNLIAKNVKQDFPSIFSDSKMSDHDDDEKNISHQDEQHFTHLNAKGDEVSMVDVGSKSVSRRIALARSVVVFPPEVMSALGLQQGIESTSTRKELSGPKGPIFSTAKLAGIMGAKRTSDLIPLCHPLPLDKVDLDITLVGNKAIIECECRVTHKTGVEMEALVGASIAALTIYDMVKAVSHNVSIEKTELISKSGGKRDVTK